MKTINDFVKNILCYFGLHTWEINQIVNSKGRLVNYHRICQDCNKEQKLQRPEKYHPTKYIWVDIDTPIKNNDQLD